MNPEVSPPITRADGQPGGKYSGLCALEVAGVTWGYTPGREVLSDVSVALRPGRLTALLGPNASGKSTLLKVMLNQAEPWAGSVTVAGRPVGELRGPALARRVSYVPQRGGVSFAFTVRQVVAMGRFAFGDEEYVDDAIEKTGLADVADRPFAELSGGQQQRVLIARAWAQSQRASEAAPPSFPGAGVVLADEPASSLDLKHAHGALALLREMADAGAAVLVVLHGLELAERWADEVWLMDRGRIVASGDRESVLVPGVLEPVYGVGLGVARRGDRRVFFVEDATPADAGGTLK